MDEPSRKVLLKMHQIARLRVRGYKDAKIAAHFGLSQSGYSRIVGTLEYKEIEDEVFKSVLGKMDEASDDEFMNLRLQMKQALPQACQALIDTMKQERDLKSRLAAAKEILDRDPHKVFSKDSKTGLGDGVGRSGELPEDILRSRTQQANEMRSKLVN